MKIHVIEWNCGCKREVTNTHKDEKKIPNNERFDDFATNCQTASVDERFKKARENERKSDKERGVLMEENQSNDG